MVDYDQCPAKPEIDALKRWQKDQNHTLERLTLSVEKLCESDAYRRGGEHMLKWIIGMVGVTGLASIISLVLGVVR